MVEIFTNLFAELMDGHAGLRDPDGHHILAYYPRRWLKDQDAFDLESGYDFHVPTRYFLRYDSVFVEWNGIPPDILIPQTKADIDSNRDLQLEAAFSYLNTE